MLWLSRPYPFIPSNFLKAVFHKFDLVHFWILYPISHKNLSFCTIWAIKLKVHFQLKRYCSKLMLTSAFIFLQSSFLFQHGKKAMKTYIILLFLLYNITGNILITIIRFALYHLLLASNSTFMTDSMFLGTNQICRSVNEHYYYLIKTTSVIWQIDSKVVLHSSRWICFLFRSG